MTSSIKVTAHVAAGKQVRVKQTNSPDVVLQDGESVEHVFYDDIMVSANEEVIPTATVDAESVSVGGDGPVKS